MPSDAPSPDALDEAMDEMGLLDIEGTCASRGPDSDAAWRVRYDAARAAVRKAAEEMGEEAVATDGTPDGQYIELRFVQPTRITDGARVRVTRIEEAP